MEQSYYNKLANQLLEAVEKIDLGEVLETHFITLSNQLLDENLSVDAKYKASIDAEYQLGLIRDFPKKNTSSIGR